MTHLLSTLGFGVVLGMQHATDADHLAAISTMVAQTRRPLHALKVGVAWGLGHTTTLVLVGLLVLGAKVPLPERLVSALELSVGIVLVALGGRVLHRVFWRGSDDHPHEHVTLHVHPHHPAMSHPHAHGHSQALRHPHEPARHHEHGHPHGHRVAEANANKSSGLRRCDLEGSDLQGPQGSLSTSDRLRAYLIGCLHGLAGSGALMVLIVGSFEHSLIGLAYVVIFGLGTLLGMGLMSMLLSLPFALIADPSSRGARWLGGCTGLVSAGLGLSIIAARWRELSPLSR